MTKKKPSSSRTKSSFAGNFTVEEATDLVNVLKSGKFPVPVTIIQETKI